VAIRTGIREHSEDLEVLYDQRSTGHHPAKGEQVLRVYTSDHDYVELNLIDILAWSLKHLSLSDLMELVAATNVVDAERELKLDSLPKPAATRSRES
jgi:hypothetical protein